MAKTPVTTVANEESEESQSRMSFGEHLEELRKRIIRSLLGSVIGVGICFYFVKEIYGFVVAPYEAAAMIHHVSKAMITTKPTEAFFTPFSLAVKAGLLLTAPWILYQIWQFIGAGLYQRERKLVYRYIGPSSLLFFLGVSFFYFLVLPMTLEFFFAFSGSGGSAANSNPVFRWLAQRVGHVELPPPATAPTTTTMPGTATAPGTAAMPVTALPVPALATDPPLPPRGEALVFFHTGENRLKIALHDGILVPTVVAQDALFINTWRADDYLSFVGFSCLIFGIAFQLPMVILVLAQTDIVQTQTFRNVRKYAYFGILIASVIIAPSGDIMTLAFLFIPMILLYEVGIICAAIATRGRPVED